VEEEEKEGKSIEGSSKDKKIKIIDFLLENK
jgi:hypothetical protein